MGAAKQKDTPRVAGVMGSQSDWPTLRAASEILDALGIAHVARIVSAHRTPERMVAFAKGAADEGIQVVIAGAGGAAHLPGMIASLTTLPVLGVPVESRALKGMDSLLSIAQMPGGVPVGTLAIGAAGAKNAGLLAASILALSDSELATRLAQWRAAQSAAVAETPVDEPPEGGHG
jgi:5-(carboxyamino)imidazole ribonucleotide mutase